MYRCTYQNKRMRSLKLKNLGHIFSPFWFFGEETEDFNYVYLLKKFLCASKIYLKLEKKDKSLNL